MAKGDAVLGEFQRRLDQLGLPDKVFHSIMTRLRTGLRDGADVHGVSPNDFGVRVARTFYKTALRATQALGSTSLSMLVMLFDLFVAYEQDRPISVSSLCIASGAAPTTALRQIGQLEARGFVIREGDVSDRRRSFVKPTERALSLIASLVEDWRAVLQP